MSKKPRRQRTPNLPPEAFITPQASPTRAASANAAAAKPAPSIDTSSDTPAKTINWQREYGAVLGDLRRTGILAGILLAVMVVLAIIIP